ncbi:MAG: GMC family oxidoreductase [Rhodospirillales bacterium]|nr:GMC family oxidoreductase [Rhodospirillales bacterium]MDE0380385.1 GMC family oxidoreductase [Rhodospirillales bacterium]
MTGGFDVVIIGSGVGGGCVAHALAPTGARIAILERGARLPRENRNWDPEAVYADAVYKSDERWVDGTGRAFRPGQFYYVGGHTKVFGATMFRFRREDFSAVEHAGGLSPAWPIDYETLEPWYARAERLFGVHGEAGADPTEPPRSGPYPHPSLRHNPVIAEVAERLRAQGLRPFPMPTSVQDHEGGACVRCNTCDGFPCRLGAKGDAETRLVDPVLHHENVSLRTEAQVARLLVDGSGRRVVAAELVDGTEVRGDLFVLAAGAVNSAAILLRSAHARHPRGLANASGTVGRHYMNHNCTAVMAVRPLRANREPFQKTLALNDFYLDDGAGGPPLGNVQLLGKIMEPMLRSEVRQVPRALRRWLAAHSVDWYAMSEDLPHPESRVTVRGDGTIVLDWRRTNIAAHEKLVAKVRALLRAAGFPIVLTRAFSKDTPSHQCGTVRFGTNPAEAPLDPFCKAFDLDNLYVVDASFFPSSAAVNPALTIAAQALRAGEHIAATRLH